MVLQEKVGELKTIRPGRSLFVRQVVLGSTSAQPSLVAVALHGTCATQTQYNPVLEALDELFTKAYKSVLFWLYDNVGCGQSPALSEWDDYSNENFALDLQSILLEFVLKEEEAKKLPCIFMGHSYAPTILLEFLNRCPPLPCLNLAGFIFVSSAIRSADTAGILMEDGGHPIMKLPVFILNCLQHQMSESFLDMALCKDCDPALKQKCRGESNGNDMAMAKATHRHHKWATSSDARVLDKVPTLVLHGSEDSILSPRCSEVIAKEVPQSKLVIIEKASHLLMLEQPTEMAKCIVDFLNQE